MSAGFVAAVSKNALDLDQLPFSIPWVRGYPLAGRGKKQERCFIWE
jgi:hypothetical protein